jgi:hypothetical protein
MSKQDEIDLEIARISASIHGLYNRLEGVRGGAFDHMASEMEAARDRLSDLLDRVFLARNEEAA